MFFSFNTNVFPRISYMNKYKTSENWMHPKRTIDEYVMFIIISGEMYIQEDNEKYHIKKDDYFILQPHKTHWGYKESQCEYYYIHFNTESFIAWDCSSAQQIVDKVRENQMRACRCETFNDDLYEKYELFLQKGRHLISEEIIQQVKMLMNEVIRFSERQVPYYKLLCSSHFVEILTLLATDFVMNIVSDVQIKTYRNNHQTIHTLLEYLNMNYKEHLSGDFLEKEFSMNFDSLNRLFKQETGFTIFKYQKKLRLKKACELLITTTLKISEISDQTGFCDQYYFSRVFTQEYGTSPKAFAKLKKNGAVG